MPGGDVNPYLALAALIAGGLHGVERGLELEPSLEGNAYTADKPHVPGHAARGARPVRGIDVARDAFGADVVAHYLNNARRRAARRSTRRSRTGSARGFERL